MCTHIENLKRFTLVATAVSKANFQINQSQGDLQGVEKEHNVDQQSANLGCWHVQVKRER